MSVSVCLAQIRTKSSEVEWAYCGSRKERPIPQLALSSLCSTRHCHVSGGSECAKVIVKWHTAKKGSCLSMHVKTRHVMNKFSLHVVGSELIRT